MSAVMPNSDLYLLRGVPLDKNYDDTYYFNPFYDNRANQYSFFSNFKKKEYSAMSYLRVNANKIRLNDSYDNVYECNYMIFKNTNHEDRYYYAFIDRVNYINEGVCEVEYTIDVIQTYWFDIKFDTSMIEREHSSTDVAGENTIDEGIMFGDMVSSNKYDYCLFQDEDPVGGTYKPRFKVVVYYIPNEKVIKPDVAPTRQALGYGWSYEYYDYSGSAQDKEKLNSWKGTIANDVFMGFTYYAFDFDVRTRQSAVIGSNTFTYLDDTRNKLVSLIDQIIAISGTICNISLVPRAVWDAEMSTGYSLIGSMTENRYFFSKANTNVLYEPKNKKMYCYPYKRVIVSNNAGQTNEYKYELSYKEHDANGLMVLGIKVNGGVLPDTEIMLYPTTYRRLAEDYESGITLADFPKVSWSQDSFNEWWAVNKQTFTLSLVSTAITSGISFLSRDMITSNNIAQGSNQGVERSRLGSTAFSAIDNLVKANYPAIAAQNTPDQLYGQAGVSGLRTKMDRIGYTLYEMSIDAESAKAIDDYFTMFGYAVKRIKTPNIFTENAGVRPYWNYVKTNGANIHPKYTATTQLGNGISADDLATIVKIFDHGIRFWDIIVGSNLGDYVYDNSPTTSGRSKSYESER